MKQIICIALLIFSIEGFSQNLVQNPGFEQYTLCPNDIDQLSYCLFWSSYGETPDYFNTCSYNANISPPDCFGGYQFPHSGNEYAGVTIFSRNIPEFREFIGSNLVTSLQIGQKYFISFFVNFGCSIINNETVSSNKMGVKFSTVQYSYSNPAPLNNTAHLYCNDIITDTVKWTKISGSFIADSAYNYIIIGNFFDDSHTDTINFTSTINWWAYYYIDDVCVSTDSLFNENWLGIKQNESKGEELTIYPNPAKDHILISSNNEDISNICITDITGKEVFTTTGKEYIDISFLYPGTYFVTVSTLNNNYTKKLVVVR